MKLTEGKPVQLQLEEEEVEVLKDLCGYVIKKQENGDFVPGHIPRSGVFAECSVDCEQNGCLSFKARNLLGKLTKQLGKE